MYFSRTCLVTLVKSKNTGYEANALQAVRSGRWGKPERAFPPDKRPASQDRFCPWRWPSREDGGSGARIRQACSTDHGSVSHTKGLRDGFILRVEAVEQQGRGQGAARGCSAAQKTPCRPRFSTQLMQCARVRVGAGAVERRNGVDGQVPCVCRADPPRCSGAFCQPDFCIDALFLQTRDGQQYKEARRRNAVGPIGRAGHTLCNHNATARVCYRSSIKRRGTTRRPGRRAERVEDDTQNQGLLPGLDLVTGGLERNWYLVGVQQSAGRQVPERFPLRRFAPLPNFSPVRLLFFYPHVGLLASLPSSFGFFCRSRLRVPSPPPPASFCSILPPHFCLPSLSLGLP